MLTWSFCNVTLFITGFFNVTVLSFGIGMFCFQTLGGTMGSGVYFVLITTYVSKGKLNLLTRTECALPKRFTSDLRITTIVWQLRSNKRHWMTLLKSGQRKLPNNPARLHMIFSTNGIYQNVGLNPRFTVPRSVLTRALF